MIECLTYLTQFLSAYVAWVILMFFNMKREVTREKSESEHCGLKVTRCIGKLRKKKWTLQFREKRECGFGKE